MADENETTKFRMKLGAAEIEYEGGTQFLKNEIMPTVGKILEMVDARSDLQRPLPALQIENAQQVQPPEVLAPATDGASARPTGSLASYLKKVGGDRKQVMRFLAAAAWLFHRGNKDLTSAMVARALQENHQSRLANPADCLNKNVTKGYCEKTKSGFFITPEGWAVLEKKNDDE